MHSSIYPLARSEVRVPHSFAKRLAWARVGAVGLQTLLLAASQSLGAGLPLLILMTGIVAVAAVSSLLATVHLRRVCDLDDPAMQRHIFADLAVLTYMLALSGGSNNPFHDAYFLPVAIAAATMAPAYAWRVAAASFACYSLVHVVFLPLPGTGEMLQQTHVAGELLTHALLTAASTYFLLLVMRNLRLRERQITEARESAARAEYAVALGSIAAGAAHELSTPMTTIDIGLAELRLKYGGDADLRRRLDQIGDGLAECKKALAVLRRAESTWPPPSHAVPVRDFVAEVLARLRAMRPEAVVRDVLDGVGTEPVFVTDAALQQAVINMLVNAVQVSPQAVTLTTSWNDHAIVFRVVDDGPGIAADVLDRLGLSFLTTKPGGHGMGLFLTRVTAQRLGGSFNIRNGPERGAVAEILVPLATLVPRRH